MVVGHGAAQPRGFARVGKSGLFDALNRQAGDHWVRSTAHRKSLQNGINGCLQRRQPRNRGKDFPCHGHSLPNYAKASQASVALGAHDDGAVKRDLSGARRGADSSARRGFAAGDPQLSLLGLTCRWASLVGALRIDVAVEAPTPWVRSTRKAFPRIAVSRHLASLRGFTRAVFRRCSPFFVTGI
jgi:hypothetical protein